MFPSRGLRNVPIPGTVTGRRHNAEVTTMDDPLAVIEAFGSACNEHDLDAALSWCTADVVFESTAPPDGERVEGQAALRAVWLPLFENPATHVEVEETIAVGDRVVQRCLYSWGDGHVRAVDVYRVTAGRIAEKLSYVKG
jgi:hypothetical protein